MSETKSFEELFLSQSMEENLKIKHLKILLLSNINSNHLYLFKLKEWQNKQNIYFDYLFFLGNFLAYSDKDKNNLKEIADDEAQTGGLLSYLENLCLNIVYIGGSNDPVTLYKKPYPNLTVKSINIHQNFFKLTDDLYLIGDGFDLNDPNKIYHLEETFHNLNKYIEENDRIKKYKTILMNNDNYHENENKKFKYEKFFKGKENIILLNLNGNAEDKQGSYKIIDSLIINPGKISDGNIGILDLERDINNNSWKVQNIEYIII